MMDATERSRLRDTHAQGSDVCRCLSTIDELRTLLRLHRLVIDDGLRLQQQQVEYHVNAASTWDILNDI